MTHYPRFRMPLELELEAEIARLLVGLAAVLAGRGPAGARAEIFRQIRDARRRHGELSSMRRGRRRGQARLGARA